MLGTSCGFGNVPGGQGGQCGQCARAAAQLSCAGKGAGGTVGKGRLFLGIVCWLGPPGSGRYGCCGAMPVEKLE